MVDLTTANHLVSIPVIPANFDLLAHTVIPASTKTSDDQNASTPRILAVAVAGLVSDSVESAAEQKADAQGSLSHNGSKQDCTELGKARAGTVYAGSGTVLSAIQVFMASDRNQGKRAPMS